jgi:hypothetical protein
MISRPPSSPPDPCPPKKAWVDLVGMEAALSKGLSPLFHAIYISVQSVGLKPALSKGLSPPPTNHVLRRVPVSAGTPSRRQINVDSLQTIRQSKVVKL